MVGAVMLRENPHQTAMYSIARGCIEVGTSIEMMESLLLVPIVQAMAQEGGAIAYMESGMPVDRDCQLPGI